MYCNSAFVKLVSLLLTYFSYLYLSIINFPIYLKSQLFYDTMVIELTLQHITSMDCWWSFYIYERTPDTPFSTPHILVYILFADSLIMIDCSRRQINYLWVWLYKSACCARSSCFREIGSVLLRATEKLQRKEKERYTGVVYSL